MDILRAKQHHTKTHSEKNPFQANPETVSNKIKYLKIYRIV